MGLGGKTKKLDNSNDKVRSAITWRIRASIKKIENAHPILAKHLNNSISTGNFCKYSPEQAPDWVLA